ncbi:hypothetical protein FA15DRAFT_660066 [Coprinopsis marcescibilis]|uniref:Uncharacterized protein n=1 Tax=Coprinopsis marcescibilis TaxID=230819 RepID=A0A5C3KTS0_COPMA|nr:hypothetical protein FA15DRAFT_660066 [Coprinopsis marcescibilis]
MDDYYNDMMPNGDEDMYGSLSGSILFDGDTFDPAVGSRSLYHSFPDQSPAHAIPEQASITKDPPESSAAAVQAPAFARGLPLLFSPPAMTTDFLDTASSILEAPGSSKQPPFSESPPGMAAAPGVYDKDQDEDGDYDDLFDGDDDSEGPGSLLNEEANHHLPNAEDASAGARLHAVTQAVEAEVYDHYEQSTGEDEDEVYHDCLEDEEPDITANSTGNTMNAAPTGPATYPPLEPAEPRILATTQIRVPQDYATAQALHSGRPMVPVPGYSNLSATVLYDRGGHSAQEQTDYHQDYVPMWQQPAHTENSDYLKFPPAKPQRYSPHDLPFLYSRSMGSMPPTNQIFYPGGSGNHQGFQNVLGTFAQQNIEMPPSATPHNTVGRHGSIRIPTNENAFPNNPHCNFQNGPHNDFLFSHPPVANQSFGVQPPLRQVENFMEPTGPGQWTPFASNNHNGDLDYGHSIELSDVDQSQYCAEHLEELDSEKDDGPLLHHPHCLRTDIQDARHVCCIPAACANGTGNIQSSQDAPPATYQLAQEQQDWNTQPGTDLSQGNDDLWYHQEQAMPPSMPSDAAQQTAVKHSPANVQSEMHTTNAEYQGQHTPGVEYPEPQGSNVGHYMPQNNAGAGSSAVATAMSASTVMGAGIGVGTDASSAQPRTNSKKRGRDSDDASGAGSVQPVATQVRLKKGKQRANHINANAPEDVIQCQWGEVVTGAVLCSDSFNNVDDLIKHLEEKHWKPEVRKEKAAHQSNPDTQKRWFAGCYCAPMCYRSLKKHIRNKHAQTNGPSPTGNAIPSHCVLHKGFSNCNTGVQATAEFASTSATAPTTASVRERGGNPNGGQSSGPKLEERQA